MSKNIKQFIPFLFLIVLIFTVYIFNLHKSFDLSWIQKEQEEIKNLVSKHSIISPLVYIIFYTVSVFLIIPDSTILTILGGIIFPLPLAVIYALTSEVFGSLVFYVVFVSIFKKNKFKKRNSLIKKINIQLKKYPVSYLLFMRMSHVVPFWLTNIIAAYFRVRNWTFFWTTLVGVLPFTYILADAGNSLSKRLNMGERLKLGEIFTFKIKLIFLFLGLCMMIPVFFKNWLIKNKK